MPEIANFVNGGAATITPALAEQVLRHLPPVEAGVTQINAPKFPHLVNQLEFLATPSRTPSRALTRNCRSSPSRRPSSQSFTRTRKWASSRKASAIWGRADDRRGARRADPERKSLRPLRRHPKGGLAEITSEP